MSKKVNKKDKDNINKKQGNQQSGSNSKENCREDRRKQNQSDSKKQTMGGKNGSAIPPKSGKDSREGSKPDKDKNNEANKNKDASMYQDPFWYAKDDIAVKDMASFPWLEIVGSRIPGTTRDTIPAMLRMGYRHALTTNADISANLLNDSGNYITRSSRAFYNYVVQGFSASVPFEAPDLTMAEIAAASLRAKMLEGRRAYTVLSYYLMTNKYYAKGIMNALGFDYDNFVQNKAEFRTQYNLRVSAINQTLVIPQKFFLSDRWDFIASYLFTDTTSPSYSSMLAYVNEATLEFNATEAKYGSCLKWKTHTPTTLYTVNSFFAEIDALLDALNDDDIRSMFAAMLRVYNEGDLKKMEAITEESPELPLFKNDIINAAVHNMHWLPTVTSDRYAFTPGAMMLESGTDRYDIPVYQDASGNILCCNTITTSNSVGKSGSDDIIIDIYDTMVDPGNVLDITATMQVVKDISATKYVFARCELYTHLYVYGDFETAGGATPVLNAVDPSWNGTTYWPVIGLTHVDSFPLLPYVSGSTIYGYLGEIDRYTSIKADVLRKLHDRCGYTLLMMPENSKSITK